MRIALHHDWNLQRAEAEQLQRDLRLHVIRTWDGPAVRTIAGVDAGFVGDRAIAAVALLSFPDLETLEVRTITLPVGFPYIPGLLSFREAPAILKAMEQLEVEPDLIVVDGQGIAHPRRFGIAAHLGVVLDRPTIGCAKSRLIGAHEPVGPNRGDVTDLTDHGETIGAVVRSKPGTKPLYISIGHRIDLPKAVEYVLASCTGYRIPEPSRRAHLAASGGRR